MSATNKDVVIEAWKTFRSRDAARIAAVFTPDAEWIAPAGNATAVALDHASHMIGADKIAHFIATEMHRLFSDIGVEFTAVHADSYTVIVEERMRATLPGGRSYENAYCFIFVLKDGRIDRVREYMDTMKGWRMVFGPSPA
jgi:uncharacterized protein